MLQRGRGDDFAAAPMDRGELMVTGKALKISTAFGGKGFSRTVIPQTPSARGFHRQGMEKAAR